MASQGFAAEARDESPVPAPPGDAAVDRGDLSTFTIADFLGLPVTVEGAAVVLAAEQHLSRRIRWLHVTELVDMSGLLQGGELILTTGIALPQTAEQMAAYIDELADQGIAGLVIELGRRFAQVPPAMVRACERRDLPLIALGNEVMFVRMTEAAHSVILMGQRRLLQITAAAHERFTELSSTNASVDELVAATGELAEGPVVFANLLHQVIALHAGQTPTADVVSRWNRTAFTVGQIFGTLVSDLDFSVVTPVDARGQHRGQLVLFAAGPPTPAQVTVMERAAAALAMRLLFEDDHVVVANAQLSALAEIVSGRSLRAEAVHARTAALGHPTRGRRYLPVVLLSDEGGLGRVVGQALNETRLDALVGQLDTGRTGVLLLLQRDQQQPQAEAFASAVDAMCAAAGWEAPVMARGGLVVDLAAVRRSFVEATDVALASWAGAPFVQRRQLYSIQDVQLRGLLYTLRSDPRVQAFVERTLGPLLLRDARDGEESVRTVAVYLRVQGNKSQAARGLGISRPTLYERIARIQRLLRVDLDDPEITASLYAAVMLVESTSLLETRTGKIRLGPPTAPSGRR